MLLNNPIFGWVFMLFYILCLSFFVYGLSRILKAGAMRPFSALMAALAYQVTYYVFGLVLLPLFTNDISLIYDLSIAASVIALVVAVKKLARTAWLKSAAVAAASFCLLYATYYVMANYVLKSLF